MLKLEELEQKRSWCWADFFCFDSKTRQKKSLMFFLRVLELQADFSNSSLQFTKSEQGTTFSK